MQKRVVQDGRIRRKKIILEKVLESSETCKNAKKEWSRMEEFGRKNFFGEKKVLVSSETRKNAKKEWCRMVEFGRKKFFGEKKF